MSQQTSIDESPNTPTTPFLAISAYNMNAPALIKRSPYVTCSSESLLVSDGIDGHSWTNRFH